VRTWGTNLQLAQSSRVHSDHGNASEPAARARYRRRGPGTSQNALSDLFMASISNRLSRKATDRQRDGRTLTPPSVAAPAPTQERAGAAEWVSRTPWVEFVPPWAAKTEIENPSFVSSRVEQATGGSDSEKRDISRSRGRSTP
ncbi:unnamed protein product, partial [Scytosiphon promiscuus]